MGSAVGTALGAALMLVACSGSPLPTTPQPSAAPAAPTDTASAIPSAGLLELIWSTDGAPRQFNTPDGIGVDRQGNLYVMDSGNNRVQKFDAHGTFLAQWGTAGNGDGQFACTEGLSERNFSTAICMLAVDRDGNVLVTDRGNSRVQKFDGAGHLLAKWGRLGTGEGEFDHPFGITVDGQGNVYVGDVGNARIQVFDSDGRFLRKWGSAGRGDGEFTADLADLAVDAAGSVFVTDRGNGLQQFDAAGRFVGRLTMCGGTTRQSATGVAIDADGSLYVFDMAAGRLCKYDARGHVIATWAGPRSTAGDDFTIEGGIAIGPGGEIYTAEPFTGLVHEYRKPDSPAPTATQTASRR